MPATLRINKERDGIELLFPETERPNETMRTAMKEQGFRWHNKGKYWYARQTPDRLAFAQKLTGEIEKASPSNATPENKEPRKKGRAAAKTEKTGNTFAAVYDSIGSTKIQDSADISLHDIPSSGVYCKDVNAFFRKTWGYDDCITVTDLTNAGKTGKQCATWRLYPQDYDGIVSNALSSEENLHTCKELLKALQEGKPLESVRVNSSSDKGIDVFSPFVEAKHLTKMPEEWNKRNFTSALLSGQIYMGSVDFHYTDDYALDAANNFGKGVGINMPDFVRDIVEDFGSGCSLYTGSVDKGNNTCSISFSEHSNSSKTLYFDLNCDIREGKRRAEERASGIKAYNDMMKASCIHISLENIDPNKIYSVTSLDMSANTGIYNSKTELMQGAALAQAFSEDAHYLEVLSAKEQEIVPDKLYEIASFYHPRKYAEPDDRIIDCGNSLQLVTGNALLELTAEGVGLPHIVEAPGGYATIEQTRSSLQAFIRGEQKYMFTGLTVSGYEASLKKLNREADRANHPSHIRASVQDLIAAAQTKASSQSSHANEKNFEVSR